MALFAMHPSVDRPDPSKDFAHVHRLAHHIVHAGGEQPKRIIKRMAFVEAEHGRVGAFPDHARQMLALAAVADQKRLDRMHVVVAGLVDPFAKLAGFDARR